MTWCRLCFLTWHGRMSSVSAWTTRGREAGADDRWQWCLSDWGTKKWFSKCYNLALAMTGIESNGQALCLYVKGQICQISRSIAVLQRNWKTFTVVLYCLLCFQRRDQSWFLLRMEMVAGFLIRNAYLLPSARLPAPPPLITSLLSLSAPSLCWLPSSQHNISLPQLIPFLLQFGHFKISVLLLSRSSFTLQSLSRLALSLFSFC